MSPADAAIQKKIYGSGHHLNLASRTTAFNHFKWKKMEDIMKIIKSLEESGLLIKRISEINKNETREQRMELLSMSLRILAASILGNALAGKRVI